MKYLIALIIPVNAFALCSIQESRMGICMTKPCLSMVGSQIGNSASATTCTMVYVKSGYSFNKWKFDHYSIIDQTYVKHGRDTLAITKEIKIMDYNNDN